VPRKETLVPVPFGTNAEAGTVMLKNGGPPFVSEMGMPGIWSSSGRRAEVPMARKARTAKMAIITTAISFCFRNGRDGVSKTPAKTASMAPKRFEPVQRKPRRARRAKRPACCWREFRPSMMACWVPRSLGKKEPMRSATVAPLNPALLRMRPRIAARARPMGRTAVRAFQAMRIAWLGPPWSMNLRTTRTGNSWAARVARVWALASAFGVATSFSALRWHSWVALRRISTLAGHGNRLDLADILAVGLRWLDGDREGYPRVD